MGMLHSRKILFPLMLFALLFLCVPLAHATVPAPPTMIWEKEEPNPNPAFPHNVAPNDVVNGTLSVVITDAEGKKEIKPPAGTTYQWSKEAVRKDGVSTPALLTSVTLVTPTSQDLEWEARFNDCAEYEIDFKVILTNTTEWDSPGTTAPTTYTVKFSISEVRLLKVTFEGAAANEFCEISEDKAGGPVYSGPHWQDNNNDGDAEDSGERRFPVAYVRDKNVKVTAVFKVHNSTPFPAGAGLKAKGEQTGGLTFPATAATINGAGTEITVTITSSNKLANTVAFLDPLSIKWNVTGNGGTKWYSGGTSDNRLYVLLAKATNTKLYESVVDAACRQQTGQTVAATLVKNIFDKEFVPLKLKKKAMDGHNVSDGAEMKYWGAAAQAAANGGTPWDTTEELVVNNAGQCGAMGLFMIDVMKAHGIAGTSCAITPDIPLPAPPPLPGYAYVGRAFAVKKAIKAQNNNSPRVDFYDHAVVKYSDIIYDPSYGKFYDQAANGLREDQWENDSVDYFYYFYQQPAPPNAGDKIRIVNDGTKQAKFNP